VTFEVALPENTPADAAIAMNGNLWQLGGRLGGYAFQPDALAMPVLDRVSSDRAEITIDLYEGTYVNYTYTLQSVSEGADQADNRSVYRSFIVDSDDASRADAVDSWSIPSWPIVTLHVTVPTNTTPGVPVGIVTGPIAWLTQVASFEWVATSSIIRPARSSATGLSLAPTCGAATAVRPPRTVAARS
jgi:hypothetical protein